MRNSTFLIIIALLGIISRSRVVVMASVILLIIYELNIQPFLNFFSDKGIEIGLVFLLLAILSSMVLTPLSIEKLKDTLISKEGLIAIFAGLLATKFNGFGLALLSDSPKLIIGIIFGSLLGISFLDGIPVGPLTASGIAALFIKLLGDLF